MKKSVKDILFYSAACALVAVFGILIYSASQKVAFQADASPSAPKPIIIIDVGHGGEDGGAVADDGTLEKDLNLSIATYLYQYFQEHGFDTIITRTEDVALGDQNLSTIRERKRSDLQKRVEIMNSYPNSITISIHQNKFEQSKYYGTQVFYSVNDADSVKLAESIRASVVKDLQPNNKRETKPATESIYVLNHAQYTAVLVECGFVSNAEELANLKDTAYQKKLAYGIFSGFLDYYKSAPG